MSVHPIFIGGCPRSGTSALLQVLNSNSSVFISAEENLLNMEEKLSQLLGSRERRAEIYTEIGMRELSVRETMTQKDILSRNFTGLSIWPMISSLYQWHHCQVGGEPLQLWGDKFPGYYKDLQRVLSIDGSRYIHITRNPFDVVNSMLRRTEMAGQGRDWWKAITNVADMVEEWCRAYRAISQVEMHKNVFHLYYEALVFDFDLAVKELNSFLEVDLQYDNIMIDGLEYHFDRPYLDRTIINDIMSRVEVKAYLKNCLNNSSVSNVFLSMNDIH